MMNDKKYNGTIVEESLIDNKILNDLEIVSVKISNDENIADRWHLYKVRISKKDIKKISKKLKFGKWYAHFWRGKEVIAVFKDKTFVFYYDKKETWKEVVDYGLSNGIPREQLDFLIE